MTGRPRYVAAPLPPYSYVPGAAPHPVSDPRGHMYGMAHETVEPLAPDEWRQSESYLRAVDLFNHGFYWEAHEAWESLWLAAGRAGPVATWMKGLIKLAAAAVKAREGNPRGARRHALRAVELIRELQGSLPPGTTQYCGMPLDAAVRCAAELVQRAGAFTAPQPALLLDGWLRLGDG